jgi:hypothetical protein
MIVYVITQAHDFPLWTYYKGRSERMAKKWFLPSGMST